MSKKIEECKHPIQKLERPEDWDRAFAKQEHLCEAIHSIIDGQDQITVCAALCCVVIDALMTLNKKQQKLILKRFALIPEIVARANSGENLLEHYLDGLFESARGNQNW